MSYIDWIIMLVTLTVIIVYGIYKSRNQTAESFITAGRQMPWHVVLLGIMATQASAITFISGPGQAFTDGMRFVQYYLGLPIAMIVISAVFVPLYQRLKVKSAYEYLDQRFDRKTRLFTGILFLISRGVSTGISVYAPAIVLSTIFGWDIYYTIIITTGLMLIYTYLGGADAIAHTQKIQFTIIILAMTLAGFMIVKLLPDHVSFDDAVFLAGASNKLNVITTDFDWKNKYNIFSGLIGGFFLALSYFGTDNSQVGRYISGKNVKESRLGLLMNGFVKIPMQFLILFIGTLLFVFYAYNNSPIFYNEHTEQKVAKAFPAAYQDIKTKYDANNKLLESGFNQLIAHRNNTELLASEQAHIEKLQGEQAQLKKEFQTIIEEHPKEIGESKDDTNYIFLHFVKNYLPIGTVGIIFCIIFLASWGSISAALNSLATSTLLDFHQVILKKELAPEKQLKWARGYTLFWGFFSMIIAFFATKMKSLIEAVNELGSLFYGPILGIFLVAFFLKRIKGNAVFIGGICAEIVVLVLYKMNIVAFLWLNVFGAIAVILFAFIIQLFQQRKTLG